MKALIHIADNEIVDVAVTEFEVHKSFKWIDCPDDCLPQNWVLVDGVPVVPAPITLTWLQARKIEYSKLNQFELISDDSINGTTTHKDAILAIKAAHPKP